jgi:DNA modification methylase
MNYKEFLQSKMEIAKETGFAVADSEINPILKPHQRDAVRWAIKGGRRALFESFGLGKTIQQLEFCRIISSRIKKQALIVCPLGVKQEFSHDAIMLGMLPPTYVRHMDDVKAHSDKQILITNYERVRDGDIDPRYFACVSLDEAAVLRSFGSKTYQTFLPLFKGVEYKLVCTATPSPNKLKELIHYSGYLEIMDTGQCLTRYFQRDSQKANNLTLYPHKETEFWLWVSTWALFITKPSDIGYDDTGYDLPPFTINYHKIPIETREYQFDNFNQGNLIRNAAMGLSAAAKEKRISLDARLIKMKEIIEESPQDHFILWHDLEAERHAIKKVIPAAVCIYGTQDLDERERRTIDFSEGRIKFFATKKKLSGSGCNFQKHCHRAIFLGIDYKFNDFIQSIHRIYRFLQSEQVVIDVIYAESEQLILDTLLEKWKQHDYMVSKMIEIIKKYGLSITSVVEKLSRSIGVDTVKIQGEKFTAVNDDSVLETSRMADDSIDLIHTSIPFANHYEYTPSYNDFGHTKSNSHFWEQMDYLTPQLLRVLKPGRIAAIHVKDRILFGNATGDGMPTCDSFHEETSLHFQKHGFRKMGMITIVTDVVRENNQTYRLGWTECTKDGTKMGVGCPEYILLFRKLPTDTCRAYADNPVSKDKTDYMRSQWQIDAHSFWRSSGNRFLSKEELKSIPISDLQSVYRKYSRNNTYNYDEHVELAKKLDVDGKLPASFMVVAPGSWTDDVWDDINRMRTFNGDQARKGLVMHICPLQFDIVERIINRYSNKGDVVYDPFAGLFTVPERAIRLGRYGYGCELSADYFRDGLGYLQLADEEALTPSMFDFIDDKEKAIA